MTYPATISSRPIPSSKSAPLLAVDIPAISSDCPPPLPRGRRTSPLERRALDAAEEACSIWGGDVRSLLSVFATDSGDAGAIGGMLTSLCEDPPMVSPLTFIRSVAGSLAGAWSCLASNHHMSTTITAGDCTLGSAMLESASLCVTEARPVLLVFFSVPAPEALAGMQPTYGDCVFAIVIEPLSDKAKAPLYLQLQQTVASGIRPLDVASHIRNARTEQRQTSMELAVSGSSSLTVLVAPSPADLL